MKAGHCRGVARAALAALVALVSLACGACGPSFQAVYECNVRFEHCYALDQQPVTPQARKECWHDWIYSYTYGQSRDRVEYAAARFSELSLDRELPAEDVSANRRRVAAVASPAPTNAFAPAPNVVEKPPEPATAAPPDPKIAAAVTLRAPGEDCAIACSASWKDCHATCNRERGCEACDRTYRQCVPRCVAGPMRR